MVLKAILETLGVFALACVFAWIGYKITQRKSKAWIISFCVLFPPVIFVILLNRVPTMVYSSVFSKLAQGRLEFVIMAICLPCIFGLLVPRLPIKRQQIVVAIFAAIGTSYFVIVPFLDPVFLYVKMKGTDTWIENGVCIQTTNSTCGAASAVTALRQLGIEAQERELALAASTTRSWGTSEHMLAKAIKRKYRDVGIHCSVKVFDEPEQLKNCCPVIAIVKYRPMVDHYVAVLDVDDKKVLIGDPLSGRVQLTHKEFVEKWRKIGIIVRKASAVATPD